MSYNFNKFMGTNEADTTVINLEPYATDAVVDVIKTRVTALETKSAVLVGKVANVFSTIGPPLHTMTLMRGNIILHPSFPMLDANKSAVDSDYRQIMINNVSGFKFTPKFDLYIVGLMIQKRGWETNTTKQIGIYNMDGVLMGDGVYNFPKPSIGSLLSGPFYSLNVGFTLYAGQTYTIASTKSIYDYQDVSESLFSTDIIYHGPVRTDLTSNTLVNPTYWDGPTAFYCNFTYLL